MRVLENKLLIFALQHIDPQKSHAFAKRTCLKMPPGDVADDQ